MRRVDIIKRAGKNIRLAKGRTILTSLAIAVGATTVALAIAAAKEALAAAKAVLANEAATQAEVDAQAQAVQALSQIRLNQLVKMLPKRKLKLTLRATHLRKKI